MNPTEHFAKYAAEQGKAEDKVLERGREEKSKKFVEKGPEVNAKV